jgi:hypothetical protein
VGCLMREFFFPMRILALSNPAHRVLDPGIVPEIRRVTR